MIPVSSFSCSHCAALENVSKMRSSCPFSRQRRLTLNSGYSFLLSPGLSRMSLKLKGLKFRLRLHSAEQCFILEVMLTLWCMLFICCIYTTGDIFFFSFYRIVVNCILCPVCTSQFTRSYLYPSILCHKQQVNTQYLYMYSYKSNL